MTNEEPRAALCRYCGQPAEAHQVRIVDGLPYTYYQGDAGTVYECSQLLRVDTFKYGYGAAFGEVIAFARQRHREGP